MAHVAPTPSVRKGIFLFIIAMNLLPFLDGMAKQLTHDGYPVMQILWARFFFSAVLIVPVASFLHRDILLKPKKPMSQIGRGILHAVSTLFLFMAFAHMPLADSLAIHYAYPFIITLLSPFLLGEKTGWRRWLAVIIGFCGTMLIIRPGIEAVNIGAIYALIGSLAFALYLILTRKLAGSAPASVTLSYQSLSSAIILSAAVPFFWVTPDLDAFIFFCMIGALSAIGHLLVITSFDHAPASLLAPLGYTELITAAGIGFIMFGDIPDNLTWLGIITIATSGIFIAWREQRQK